MTFADSATQRLSRSWPWRDLLLLLLIVAALPLFFVSTPDWLDGELARAFANLGHIPFFALLTLLINSRFPLRQRVRRCLAISVAVLVLSIGLEWLQAQVGRSADWGDVLRNLTGAWLTIFWLQKPGLLVWLGRGAALAILALDIASLARVVSAEYRLANQLPVIASFEHEGRAEAWQSLAGKVERVSEHSSEGSFALEVRLSTASYSGLALTRLARNWLGYEQLRFDLFNPGTESFAMTLRIHDARHESGAQRWRYSDRLNKKIHVDPGWNHYSIDLQEVVNAPQDRELNLEAVRNLSLFAAGLSEAEVIYVDNFRLQ